MRGDLNRGSRNCRFFKNLWRTCNKKTNCRWY